MRIALILCLSFFGTAFADTLIEAKLKLTCTLPINNFMGTVQLMEHDTFADAKITREIGFSPTTEIAKRTHSITLSGSDWELIWFIKPYLKFRHNCTPNGDNQEYRVKLVPCNVESKKCSVEVDVQLGEKNTATTRNFYQY